MHGVEIAFIAQVLIAVSLIVDKTLLKEKLPGNVFAYVFWIGVFNIFGVFLIPLDFVMPSLKVAIIGFLAGVFFLLGPLFYYNALQKGEASQTLAVLGGFTPLATILLSLIFLSTHLNIAEVIFFIFLTIGGFIMFLADRKKFKNTIGWIILAAICLGFLDIFQKIAYTNTSFLTGFGIMKLGAFSTAMAMLVVPSWRNKIYLRTRETENRSKAIYLSNRALTAIGSFLLSYAIKLDHPALIEATSSLKYVVIFVISLALAVWWPKILKENFKRWALVAKITATFLIVFSITGLMIQKTYEELPKNPPNNISWGVSFSEKMSKDFGLDWSQNYTAILDELNPRSVRLIAYWDLIEPTPGNYDFSDLDWQVDEAQKRNIPVIIAFGQKVPRWPECHYPGWINVKDKAVRESSLLKYETTIINRYKNSNNLKYWQVENEPYLTFGTCPSLDKKFYQNEINLTKQLDPNHKILLTDGGEYGKWYFQSRDGDVFGTTLYRKVYKKYIGSYHPLLTPEYYTFKEGLVKVLNEKQNQKFVISELGLEPWWNKQVYQLPNYQQEQLLSINEFNNIADFARKTNIDEIYMWGAEWWYYMKTQNNLSYWKAAQSLIKSGK